MPLFRKKKKEKKSKNLVFGKPLPKSPEDIPEFIPNAIQNLKKRGMAEEGIFRVPGNAKEIQILKYRIDNDEPSNLEAANVHSVASLLKLYFRELPEPLFPYNTFDLLVAIEGLSTKEIKTKLLSQVIPSLPDTNLSILRMLIKFLHQISENASVNMMNPGNLAIVFAPNLLRKEGEEELFAMNSAQKTNNVFKYMISNPDCLYVIQDIFADHPEAEAISQNGSHIALPAIDFGQSNLDKKEIFEDHIQNILNAAAESESEEETLVYLGEASHILLNIRRCFSLNETQHQHLLEILKRGAKLERKVNRKTLHVTTASTLSNISDMLSEQVSQHVDTSATSVSSSSSLSDHEDNNELHPESRKTRRHKKQTSSLSEDGSNAQKEYEAARYEWLMAKCSEILLDDPILDMTDPPPPSVRPDEEENPDEDPFSKFVLMRNFRARYVARYQKQGAPVYRV